ncbi:MAG: S8 family peptidase, partial [Candidatus Heimdallarchaeaceae archaeon]
MNVRHAIISALFSLIIIAVLPLQAITAAPSITSFNGSGSPSDIRPLVPSSIETQNMLKDRWKTPLSPTQIYTELYSYKQRRALISFFSFEERKDFISVLSKRGYSAAVERLYSSFPALILSYSKIDLRSIDFSQFRIKYTYPIGTKGFTIPQNVETSFGTETSLSEIRKALEIDKLHHELNAWGYGVVIALLDSGMNISQSPSLVSLLHYPNISKVIASWKMTPFEDINDRSGHGTHIASILAGNGKYIIDGELKETKEYGIAPDAQLVNIKVLDKTGYGKDEWLIAGLDKAIEMDVDIISASLTSITYERIGDPMEELVYTAAANGIMVVASAGNYGPMGASAGGPAIWDYVISVGATTDMHKLTYYSSRGPSPDLLPGVDVLAPGRFVAGADASTGGISYISGTSVSTPIVSGVLAIYRELFPNASISRLESALLETADDLNLPVTAQGVGFVDPYEGYSLLKQYENSEIITINPKRISPENIFYYSCVEGTTKQFNSILISTTDTFIQVNVTGDSDFIQISKNISVTQGWNHISWNITIPYYTPFRNINAEIVFYGVNTTTTKITIDLQTRFYGGTILFDASHDNDTENSWFDGSSQYGAHQFLGRILMDRGFN